jgi:hypothetical protein
MVFIIKVIIYLMEKYKKYDDLIAPWKNDQKVR